MNTPFVRQLRPAVAGAALIVFCTTIVPAAAQTRSATLTQWDIFTATGGDGSATQNPPALVRDASGVAGPPGSVWIGAQAPELRIGRLDPNAAVNNYTEWVPLSNGEGGVLKAMALNEANGDVWASMQGAPSFLLKLAGTDTFRRFDTVNPLVPQGITIAADGALIAALPEVNVDGQGRAIMRIPRDVSSTQPVATWWRFDLAPAAEPRDVAVDGAGRIWYTDSLNNVVARLDPATDGVTEWALPAGTSPAGLHVSPDAVCVASDGLTPDTGVVQCLDPSTNQVTVFTAAPGAALDRPQYLARNSFGELFVTEWHGNAVAFIGQEAYGAASTVTVTPAERTRQRVSLQLYAATVTAEPRVSTVVPTVTTLAGASAGDGQTRFSLPEAALTYPFPLTGYPQPYGISTVFGDGEPGTGAVYVAESFSGPLGQFAAARIARIELVAARELVVLPSSLHFEATAGLDPPPSATFSITEASGHALEWAAAHSQSWVTLSAASGATPASVAVAVDHAGLAEGTYTDVITISDPSGRAQPVTVQVTLTVAAPTAGLLTLDPALLALTVVAGGDNPPAQQVAIRNDGVAAFDYTTAISSGAPWLSITAGAAGQVAPAEYALLTLGVETANLAAGVHVGTVEIAAEGVPNAPQTLTVTVTVQAPAISLATSALSLTIVEGNTPDPVMVDLTNTGDALLQYTATSGAAWLSVTPATGDVLPGGSTSLTVAAPGSSSLAPGTYTGTIVVSDPTASTGSGTIAVTLTVVAAARFTVSPSPVLFQAPRLAYCNSASVGSGWRTQEAVLTNTGGTAADFALSNGTSWLHVSPASGSLAPGESVTLTVAVDISHLPLGLHLGSFTVSAPGAPSATTPVELLIGNAPATLCLTPTTMAFGTLRRGATSASQSLSITNVGDDPMGLWSSTQRASDGTILMSATVGAVPSTVSVAVQAGKRRGEQSGAITVTVGTGAVNGTQDVTLSWTVQ